MAHPYDQQQLHVADDVVSRLCHASEYVCSPCIVLNWISGLSDSEVI